LEEIWGNRAPSPVSNQYSWSSAAAHYQMKADPILTKEVKREELIASKNNWIEWLKDPPQMEKARNLKKSTQSVLSETYLTI